MQYTTWEMKYFNTEENPVWNINSDYGSFHMYAVFMTIGVITAILISAFKLWRKKVSLNALYIGAIPIVIISLFGASFFGKMPLWINGDDDNLNFFTCFEFWKGGMSIHGGVLAGALSGIIIFSIIGKYTKVSVLTYMDAIIPNILIGQAIGRWGNFFNHELVGQPVSVVGEKNIFSWLPNFILRNTQFQYIGPASYNYKGLILEYGKYYQMTPIFIIESAMLTMSWLLITVIIPGIGRWISKKPWKIDSNEFAIDIKQSFKKPLTTKKSSVGYSYWECWNKAFYQNVDKESVKQYYIKLKELNEVAIADKYSFIKYKYKAGKLLLKANNPNKYRIPYCGIEAGAYFFLWNIVRFSLEFIRPDDVLFISYKRTLSLFLVGAASFIGVIIMLLSIFVFPIFKRQQDFMYEKNYFLINNEENNKIFKWKEFIDIKRG